MKKIGTIFILAFVFNVIWENIHAILYASYKGGEITQFILLRASLFDAIVITLLLLPFLFFSFLENKKWLILLIGILIAVVNEWYGLTTSRWVYNSLMPIVPFIEVGLTPMLQLGLLGYLVMVTQDAVLQRQK
ncbi:TPA: hypothetical protein DEP58_04735 [Patescibacteria group bacterium]|nr:hypothetical protein [Patescibacteria group bacterium]